MKLWLVDLHTCILADKVSSSMLIRMLLYCGDILRAMTDIQWWEIGPLRCASNQLMLLTVTWDTKMMCNYHDKTGAISVQERASTDCRISRSPGSGGRYINIRAGG